MIIETNSYISNLETTIDIDGLFESNSTTQTNTISDLYATTQTSTIAPIYQAHDVSQTYSTKKEDSHGIFDSTKFINKCIKWQTGKEAKKGIADLAIMEWLQKERNYRLTSLWKEGNAIFKNRATYFLWREPSAGEVLKMTFSIMLKR